jgi:uncharacterized protein (DUF1015 family)
LAEIQPFAGVRYRAPDLSRLLAPPYDVISDAYRAELCARDPHNVVRVILARSPDDAGYDEAGETYRRWLREGVLEADPEPGLYLLEQSFPGGGKALRRFGVLARFRAEDAARRVILPHEHTRAAAREDRWRMLNATRANFSPIFLMFPDPTAGFAALVLDVIGHPPTAQYADDAGVGHRLWRVRDDAVVGRVQRLLGSVPSYIADGHHRHATALRHRDGVGPDGAWTLGYFTPIDAPGLVVLPYHRLLSEGPTLEAAESRLASRFQLAPVPGGADAAAVVAASRAAYAFALAWPGGDALVAEAGPEAESLLSPVAPLCLRVLDAYFLHHAVLGPLLGVPEAAVSYVHSLAEAEEALVAARCRLAVLMRATPVRQIVDVADAGESMPAKSTFFHPKLPSGLVIHPLVA